MLLKPLNEFGSEAPKDLSGFFFMIKSLQMEQFEFVRWFTDDDYSKLKSIISYHKDKNNTESQLTWLQSHSDEVIKIHEHYYIDERNRQWNNYKERVKDHNKKLDNIKNGGQEYCICGSLLKWYRGEFAGCSNFSDQTKQHKSYNYRTDDIVTENDLEIKISDNYLSSICKIIKTKHNIKIQASNLYEFYVLNKVKLFRDDISREKYGKVKESSALSKKRELLIKSILEKNKIRFGYQRKIMYKIKGYKETHAIPDFIAMINNDFLIIEQKKNIENCFDYQVEKYKSLLEFMYPNKGIQIVYVIEEDNESLNDYMPNYPVLTLDKFKDFIS
jgi:hypothetical protein